MDDQHRYSGLTSAETMESIARSETTGFSEGNINPFYLEMKYPEVLSGDWNESPNHRLDPDYGRPLPPIPRPLPVPPISRHKRSNNHQDRPAPNFLDEPSIEGVADYRFGRDHNWNNPRARAYNQWRSEPPAFENNPNHELKLRSSGSTLQSACTSPITPTPIFQNRPHRSASMTESVAASKGVSNASQSFSITPLAIPSSRAASHGTYNANLSNLSTPPATQYPEDWKRNSLDNDTLTVAGRGLSVLSGISDHSETVVKHVEEYLATGERTVYGITKEPAFIRSFLILVEVITHFATTMMRGGDEARAMFRGILKQRITSTYQALLGHLMEIPYKLEALTREQKMCKYKRELMGAILRLEETSAKFVMAMENYVEPNLVGSMRWDRPEYLVSRIKKSVECWVQLEYTKTDKFLHPKDVKAIDEALGKRRVKQEAEQTLKKKLEEEEKLLRKKISQEQRV